MSAGRGARTAREAVRPGRRAARPPPSRGAASAAPINASSASSPPNEQQPHRRWRVSAPETIGLRAATGERGCMRAHEQAKGPSRRGGGRTTRLRGRCAWPLESDSAVATPRAAGEGRCAPRARRERGATRGLAPRRRRRLAARRCAAKSVRDAVSRSAVTPERVTPERVTQKRVTPQRVISQRVTPWANSRRPHPTQAASHARLKGRRPETKAPCRERVAERWRQEAPDRGTQRGTEGTSPPAVRVEARGKAVRRVDGTPRRPHPGRRRPIACRIPAHAVQQQRPSRPRAP